MVIGKGSILFDGDIARLRNTVTPERVVKIDFLEVPRRLEYPMTTLSFFDDSHAEFRFNPEITTATEIIGAISQDNQIKDFIIENPPIEEIIARMYDGFAI